MSTEIDPRHKVIITEAKYRLVNDRLVPIGSKTVVRETNLDDETDPEGCGADEIEDNEVVE